VIRHVLGLWGRAWFVPALPLAYAGIMWVLGDLRPEHVLIALLIGSLAYAHERSKRFVVEALPCIAVGYGYDLVRYARAAVLTPGRVLGCELRSLELTLFSVSPGVTPQDWFSIHHSRIFDLILAVPYTIFVYLALMYAAYLYVTDRPRMRHYLWSFAIANYISFFFWLALPAAPPWYLRAHGCAIDLATAPNPAGLLRVDEYLGTSYFRDFYSRAASVFGALPSMHCAYPLIGLLTAFRAATVRTLPFHVLYTVAMFAASVYFDHHWIVDGVFGWAVAVVAVLAARKLLDRLPQLSSANAAPARAALPERTAGEPQRSAVPVAAPPKVL
jgi:inositol phosphorylceramide synthase catalytic subunit